MNKTSPQKRTAFWFMAAAIAVGLSLYVQQVHQASAAPTVYPAAVNATFTPDNLLW